MAKSPHTGYKLHLQRLIFSAGTTIRSIKFPLQTVHGSSTQLKKAFENSIIADDLKTRGSINLPDYMQNPNSYTLADFWVDSLRAGVIWQPTGPRLTNFVRKFFNEPSLGEAIFEKAAGVNDKLKFFIKEAFVKNIILAGPKRTSGSPTGFKRALLDSVKPKYKTDDHELTPKTQKVLDKVVNNFYEKDGTLKLRGLEAQNEYWLQEFNIDKSMLKEGQHSDKRLAKLTFFILPQLISLDNPSPTVTKLVEQRKRLFVEEKEMIKIFGLEDNFNALSHYLNNTFQLLFSGQTDDILQAFKERVPSITKDEQKINQALQFLSSRAQELGHPKTDKGWHGYRSGFGGKIQSWFRNYQRRDKKIQEQTQKLQKGSKKAQAVLDKSVQSDPSLKQEAQSVTDLLNQINEFTEQNISNLQDSKIYEIFSDLLAQARRELNFFYQRYVQEEGDDVPVNEHKELKDVYTPVYKPMTFFAQGRLEQNKKILNKTVDIIKEGLQISYRFLGDNQPNFDPSVTFEDVKRKNETPEALYRRALQRIWARLRDKSVNSVEFRERYGQILISALKDENAWNKIYANPTKYCFYKSPYAKGTHTEVALKSVDFLSGFELLVKDLCEFTVSLKDVSVSIFDDKALLQDISELLKTILSYLIRFNTEGEFGIAGLDLPQFEKAQKYLELLKKDKLNKNEAAYFYQSLILSELRGAITVSTKELYTSRYVLQVMRTPDKFPLFYFSKTKSLDEADLELNQKGKNGNGLLSQKPHYYCVASQEVKLNKKIQESPFLRLDKKEIGIVGFRATDNECLLKISTSPHQLQFLERFVSPVGDWRKVNITLSDWSFIVEKDYNIDWTKELKQPTFNQIGETKLFVSIPFQISAKTGKNDAALTELASDRPRYPVLGIDVGEYGVGWVLAGFDNGTIAILRKGFIQDKNIAVIQDHFASLQARTRKGAFSASSNTVAEVRENAIGAVRNQIHDILTSETASVVYEYSISNFETGSGRVTRVYNSVKRADVSLDTDADKRQHGHVWGKYTKLPGTHLSAYASSYICVACAHSIYEFGQEDVGQAKVTARDGNILTIRTPKGDIRGYIEDKNVKEGFNFKGTREGFKEFMKLVKDFARPPVSSQSESLQKFASNLAGKGLDKIAKERGSSAIFVCPFAHCHKVTDADIQAAFMMAIRGYLNWSGKVKSNENEKKDYLGKTLEFLASIRDKDQLVTDLSVKAEVA